MDSSYDATKTKKKEADCESSSSRQKTQQLELVEFEKRQHFQSSLALCFSVFLTFYTSVSVFPYLGFMVLQLVAGLDRETVGVRVGFLASSFMMGRTITSYGWGRLADVYGRKFVLITSLAILSIGSITFGCSSSYPIAILIRFVMGAGNGTMIVARTSISELAKGNHELETKGVGILMGMNGFSLLLCPSLGGLLAEPIQQYFPHYLLTGRPQEEEASSLPLLVQLLEKFPFLLPNLLASILSLISILLVNIYVEETLPLEQRRHWSNLGTDIVHSLFGTTVFCCRRKKKEFTNKPSSLTATSSSSSSSLTGMAVEEEEDPEMTLNHQSTPTETTPLVTSSSSSSSLQPQQQHQQQNENEFDNNNNNIIRLIWNQKDTRAYLISAWCNHFASICYSEAFPLFAMSIVGGLGLEERLIGIVGTGAGLLYVIGQYTIFRWAIGRFGVIRGIQHATLVATLPFAVMPLSLWFPSKSWAQIGYLAVVMAIQSIARSIFMGGNTIKCNRTVAAQHRAAMNGISSTGTGLARGLGPIFTGGLMAFCLSHPLVPKMILQQLQPHHHQQQQSADVVELGGGWAAYGVLTMIAFMAYLSTRLIPNDDDDAKEGGK